MKSTSSSRPMLRGFLITTAAVASAVALTWAPSRANEAALAQPPSMTVRYADLDLHNSDGLATLYQRIVTAAATVCGGDSDATSLSELTEFRSCSAQSVQHAVTSVGNHDLSVLHARRTHHHTVH